MPRISPVHQLKGAPSDSPSESRGGVSLSSFLKRLVFDPRFHGLLLIIAVSVCFGRTLSSYFLADDIGEIKYVAEIFAGRLDLLWSNFTGNYMQIPSMNVYRPWLLMTLVLDFAVWKANPLGYYLTNLLYFAADCLLLYGLIFKICAPWGIERRSLSALASSMLFAVSPLHCESISWIVGRVDAACCFYYLSSFHLFVLAREGNTKWLSWLAVAAFWMAMLTKEMAIGLPVLLAAYGFFFVSKTSTSERLSSAWQWSKPVVYCLPFYFALRFLCLGTILGGYSGSIGASQTANALSRWLDLDTAMRLVFPLANQIFGQQSMSHNLLGLAYTVLVSVVAVRTLANELPWKHMAFLAVWALSCLAPIYRLWGIGYDLEGARFCFFFSLVMSSILPLLIFAPATNGQLKQLFTRLQVLGALTLCLLAFVYGRAAYATNLLWIHAGKEVRQVSTAAQRLSKQSTKKIIVLGIPKEKAGAHMILNGDTFKMLLSSPFVGQDCWQSFITFDPIVFGPDKFINASRLAKLKQDPTVIGPYVWNSKQGDFLPVSAKYQTSPDKDLSIEPAKLVLSNLREGDLLKFSGLNVNPYQYDFLEFEYLALDKNGQKILAPLVFAISWPYSEKLSFRSQGGTGRVRLSRLWTWFARPALSGFNLDLPAVDRIELSKFRLVPAHRYCPSIGVQGQAPAGTGVYRYVDELNIQVDALTVGSAQKVDLEVSKPDFFFDNFTEEMQGSALMRTVHLNEKNGKIKASELGIVSPGYYELRARALDSKNEPIGEYSDTVVLAK